jgi:hypothetical protein
LGKTSPKKAMHGIGESKFLAWWVAAVAFCKFAEGYMLVLKFRWSMYDRLNVSIQNEDGSRPRMVGINCTQTDNRGTALVMT